MVTQERSCLVAFRDWHFRNTPLSQEVCPPQLDRAILGSRGQFGASDVPRYPMNSHSVIKRVQHLFTIVPLLASLVSDRVRPSESGPRRHRNGGLWGCDVSACARRFDPQYPHQLTHTATHARQTGTRREDTRTTQAYGTENKAAMRPPLAHLPRC
jgi:hypothetical protein